MRELLHRALAASEQPGTVLTSPAPQVMLINEIAPPPLITNVVQNPVTSVEPVTPVTLVTSVTLVTNDTLHLLLTNTWISWSSWSEATGLGRPRSLRNAINPTYVLQTTNGSSSLSIGIKTALLNNAECWLGFAPKLIQGQPHIHTLDVQKNLQPLLLSVPDLCVKNRTVVLDPGHGGEDPGTKSVLVDRYEKEFTLDWAKRLRVLLLAQGWQVFLTRTNDTDLTLANRVKVADDVDAGFFISLHFNSASTNVKQAGLETYCLTPAGMPSNLIRNYPDNIKETFPNNAFDVQNIQLAAQLHRAVLDITKRPDRGLRRARFLGVLRGHHRPAVLIEGGYLSNPQEARLIADSSYRQKLAQGVANALKRLIPPDPSTLTKK
jgi:N-acetylmuramoyl-L-alanine amidase